jgi:hypothetical protein
MKELTGNKKIERLLEERRDWRIFIHWPKDRLCGPVVRVPGYRSRGAGLDSRHYQIFWEVVGLEQGPLSLVRIIEELLGRNSSSSSLENREYGHGDPLRRPRDTLYPQKLAVTSLTRGGRSVSIGRLRTKATEFVCFVLTHIKQKQCQKKILKKTDTPYSLCVHFVHSVQSTCTNHIPLQMHVKQKRSA